MAGAGARWRPRRGQRLSGAAKLVRRCVWRQSQIPRRQLRDSTHPREHAPLMSRACASAPRNRPRIFEVLAPSSEARSPTAIAIPCGDRPSCASHEKSKRHSIHVFCEIFRHVVRWPAIAAGTPMTDAMGRRRRAASKQGEWVIFNGVVTLRVKIFLTRNVRTTLAVTQLTHHPTMKKGPGWPCEDANRTLSCVRDSQLPVAGLLAPYTGALVRE